MIRHLTAAAAVVGVVAWPRAARAQDWKLSVDAGRIGSALDPSARGSRTLVAGADYESPSSAFRLSIGVPTPADSVHWGAIGGWKRIAATRDRFTAGLDLSGNAFVFRASGSVEPPVGGGILDPLRPPIGRESVTTSGRAIAAQALPMVSVETGPLQLQARAGVSYYDATTRDDARDRVAGLTELQLLVRASPVVAFAPVVRRVAPRGEDAATFAGLSGFIATGPLRLSAHGGQWRGGAQADDADRAAWSVNGALRVTHRASITAGARRDAVDPLYRTPAQTSWSLGASLLLHSRARAGAPPVADRDGRGAATIRLAASKAGTAPRIAGDFNDWKPTAMERDGNEWRYRVAAAPGVYNYAFVAPDGTWYVPDGTAGRKNDGMGGHVAVVVIR